MRDPERRALFFDLEFTAWPDSLATGWMDPARPAEVVQLGAAVVALDSGRVARTFRGWVRPSRNPVLSGYCRDLLGVEQAVVDRAPSLTEAMGEWDRWLTGAGSVEFWTSWGVEDLELWAADCRRSALPEPAPPVYVDLMRESGRRLGLGDLADRERVKERLGLTGARRRHDALADALDLVHIRQALDASDAGGEPRELVTAHGGGRRMSTKAREP